MKRKFDWRYVPGAALLLAVTAVVLAVFSLMNRVGGRELLLADSRGERFGWSYELLVDGEARPYAPEFSDEYTLSMPEDTEAVRIRRTMTEEIDRAELEWMSYFDGVELFLDGESIYTDFPWLTSRDGDGYLHPSSEDWDRLHRAQGESWRRGRVTLPADYRGRELSVTTYFPEDWGLPVPEYPTLGSEDSYIAKFVVLSMPSTVATVVCAILALMMAAMFLLDISNGRMDGGMLLLCLYFLLLFLNQACSSDIGYYSELFRRANLSFLRGLYVAPLYLYLARRLTGRRKYLLCGGIAAWLLYEGFRMLMNVRQGRAALDGRSGVGAFLLFLVMAAAMCAEALRSVKQGRQNRRRMIFYGCAALAVTLFCGLNYVRAWGSVRRYLVEGIGSTLASGNFQPVTSLVNDIVSMMALIVVIAEFVRRTLRTRQEMGVLQDRARQSMESYQRLLTAQDATNALRHEMRHHMIALSGMLNSGDADRAMRYVNALAGDLDRLPTGRYSPNPLVDVIAGSFLDRAWARQIQVEHRLNVPPELNIADEDLSVFLSNMLQNALEACERMDAGAKRYISVEMRLRGNFLFVKCVNSAPEESGSEEDRRRSGHGYGLSAMRRIAEKYNSVLILEHSGGEFSVKSDLYLRRG